MPQRYMEKANRFALQYRDYMRRSFSSYDFTPNEISVLLFLFTHEQGRDTASDIARECLVSKALVTRSVVSLTQRGYIEPKRSMEDRRIIHLKLTGKSFALGESLEKAQRELNRKLFSGSTPEDVAAFERVLSSIEANMQQLSHGHK